MSCLKQSKQLVPDCRVVV